MPGLFVTGTDTAAGKTVLTAAVVAALRVQGETVRVLKPVITGLDEPPDSSWPHDHEVLATASGASPRTSPCISMGHLFHRTWRLTYPATGWIPDSWSRTSWPGWQRMSS